MYCCASRVLCLALLWFRSAPAQQSSPKLRVDGLIDGYYGWNQNYPVTGQNQWHLFDTNANAWSLSLARVAIDREPDLVGFRVEVGAGNTYKLMHSFDPAPHVLQYSPQAFVKWKPALCKGIQLDAGKFYTSTGIEVADTDQNWNYSHSLLFSWAQPAYHFGLRTSIPIDKHVVAAVQVVNGWNNVRDNNSGKSLGLTANLSWSHVSWTHVYYAGPEKTGTNRGWRHLYDSSLLVTPVKPVTFYLNFDYATERRRGGSRDRWAGIGGAARIAAGPKFSISPRLEWFHDAGGFATGTAQSLKEATLTPEWRMCRAFASRLEFRRDWSDHATFPHDRSHSPSRSQNTVVLGLLATFSTKR
jgi:Putative beta-barrel porin-2, OmpL-like. bbp2